MTTELAIDCDDIIPACPCCTEKGKLTCSSCRDVDYCSIECQETDWPAHKYLCSKLRHFSDDARPSERMRRCLFFPPQSDQPRFIWLESKDITDEAGAVQYQQPNMVQQMGTEAPYFDTVVRDEYTGVKLDRHIHVCYHEDALDRYTEDNGAVRAVTGGLARCSWRGPIVAYCGVPDAVDATDADVLEVTDMDLLAYRRVIAHFIDWQNDEKKYLMLKGPKIEAVKAFADDTLEKRNGGLRFKAVKLSRMHPSVGAEGEISEVSRVCVYVANRVTLFWGEDVD